VGRYGIANFRYDVPNFYDEWLAAGERIQTAFRDSPTVARDVDIPWIRTRQDAKVKLMVSNSRFPMMGGGVLRGEIPVGWNTGQHAHGEESLRVLRGRGFSGHRPTEIGLARDPSQESDHLRAGPPSWTWRRT